MPEKATLILPHTLLRGDFAFLTAIRHGRVDAEYKCGLITYVDGLAFCNPAMVPRLLRGGLFNTHEGDGIHRVVLTAYGDATLTAELLRRRRSAEVHT